MIAIPQSFFNPYILLFFMFFWFVFIVFVSDVFGLFSYAHLHLFMFPENSITGLFNFKPVLYKLRSSTSCFKTGTYTLITKDVIFPCSNIRA